MSLDADAMQALSSVLATAIESAIMRATQTASASTPGSANSTPQESTPRAPPFKIHEYKSTDMSSVSDYFNRFDWALELSKIPDIDSAKFVRVHMGTELNNALKILASPSTPEVLTYQEIKKILTNHFDHENNKYAKV